MSLSNQSLVVLDSTEFHQVEDTYLALMLKCNTHILPIVNCLQAKLDPGCVIEFRFDAAECWDLVRVGPDQL